MTQQTSAEQESAAMNERVRASFARQGLMRHMGAEITHVEAGIVRIRLPYRAELTQQHGFFHAGGTSAIADSAGGYAGFTLFPPDSSVLTVEFKINLIAPAQGDYLEAIGKVIRSGRTLTICHLEVFGVVGHKRTLVAVGQQTLICMHGKPDPQHSPAA